MPFLLTLGQIVIIAVAMLVAFHLRRRLTLVPLCVLVGAMQYLQTIAAATIYVPLPMGDGLIASPGSMAMFSSSLFAVLLIYITEDIPTTRATIYGVIAANVLLTVLSMLVAAQLASGAINLLAVPQAVFELNVRMYLAGTGTLLADTYLIVITFEFLSLRVSRLPLAARTVSALVVTLSFDAIVFSTLAFVGSPQFGAILAGNLIGKAIASVMFGTILALYLQFFHRDPNLQSAPASLRDVFTILTYRERYEAVRQQNTALEQANAEVQRLFDVSAEQQGRLTALLHSSRDGLVMLNMERRVLFLNAPAHRLLALPGEPADWTGRHWRDAMAGLGPRIPGVMDLTFKEERRVSRGDEVPGEGEIAIGDQTIAWANLPVQSEGRVEGRLVVLRDVTAERQLARLREEVGQMMVHDLRSPLTVMTGSLSLLKADAALDEDGRALVDSAASGATRMLGMVNGLLDLYKLESGVPDLHRTRFAVQDMMRTLLAPLTALAGARDVELQVEVPPDLTMQGDEALLGRVMLNLGANAVSFAPAGSTVTIDACSNADGVMITVADAGPGVNAGILPRLFQKFASTRQGAAGTGLGLAFCRLAVEAHGGRIWYEPGEPSGSRFRFVVPHGRISNPESGPDRAARLAI